MCHTFFERTISASIARKIVSLESNLRPYRTKKILFKIVRTITGADPLFLCVELNFIRWFLIQPDKIPMTALYHIPKFTHVCVTFDVILNHQTVSWNLV